MEIKLNTSSVSNLASVAEALKSDAAIAAEAAPILSAKSLNVTESSPDLDALLSKLLMETNEAKLNAARSRLASALDQLTNLGESEKKAVEEMRNLAEAQNQAEKTLASKSRDLEAATKELKSAEKALDLAKAELALAEKNASQPEIDAAENKVESAKKRLDAASQSFDVAQNAYHAISNEVSSLQTKFDRLLDSLDISSLTALREAIRLDAGDINHLHNEIEKDDEKHDLASIKAVEDVIADALDRLDGKMVDEVTDRHLEHA
jgi:chromosome segregation ATPase